MEYKVDRDYLEKRYRQSLRQAERATNPGVARTHREFAQKYAEALKNEGGSQAR